MRLSLIEEESHALQFVAFSVQVDSAVFQSRSQKCQVILASLTLIRLKWSDQQDDGEQSPSPMRSDILKLLSKDNLEIYLELPLSDSNKTVNMHSPKGIPIELWCMVVEELSAKIVSGDMHRSVGHTTETSNLKNLRLVCHFFANLGLLMKKLFARAKFIASLEHLEKLQSTSISRIGPYITSLRFPPPYKHWTFQLDDYKYKVFSEEAAKQNRTFQTKEPHSSRPWNRALNDFVREVWQGNFPLSEDQLHRGLSQYQQEDLVNKMALLSGELLHKTWVMALKHLKHCHVFVFRSDGSQAGTSNEIYHGDWDRGSAMESLSHIVVRRCGEIDACYRAEESLGRLHLRVAIQSMAAAKSIVQHLALEMSYGLHQNLEVIPGWGDLDCQGLRTLRFHPCYWEREHTSPVVPSTNALLRKCNDSLETFQYVGDARGWPQIPEVVPLPNLRKLTLGCVDISEANFTQWLKRMPRLQYVEWDRGTSVKGTWRGVFRAIRDHPRNTFIKFEVLPDYDENNFVCVKGWKRSNSLKVCSVIKECNNGSCGAWICLPRYIMGEVGWNLCLRHTFNDRESREDASEDDDGKSGYEECDSSDDDNEIEQDGNAGT